MFKKLVYGNHKIKMLTAKGIHKRYMI